MSDWSSKLLRDRDLEAIATQESLLADYEEMVIDKPADPLLVSRFYGRIKELKKTLNLLRQRAGVKTP